MKDKFLAEEMDIDPYGDFAPDDSLDNLREKDFLTKDDFKDQDSTLKVNGRRWVCDKIDCRCNVGRFSLCNKFFKCNGCDTIFEVE